MRARSLLVVALATLGAGCLSPQGYYRADDGAPAAGGAPAQGGTTGSGGVGTGGATGGNVGTGGNGASTGNGGATGSGGAVTATGGTTGTGGAAGAPPPPPGTVLYGDDFEGDTVGGQATGWLQDTIDSDTTKGTFSVVSDSGNKVLQGAANSSDFIMDIGGDVAWTDYTFQVDIKMTSGSSFEFGVFGRFALGSDKGNYYEAYMDDSGAVQLRVRLNGSTTTLGTKSKSTTGNAVLGTVYTFKLDLHGSTISVSVNGVPRVSMVMDTTLGSGGIGLIVNNGTAEFDNVYVTE
jgi:hypothetical protein